MKFLIIFENLSPENLYLLFGDKKIASESIAFNYNHLSQSKL